MLIITADDYGKNKHSTESILECFKNERITSASAMVFMDDSDRAASISLNTKLEIGLHLNFTQTFTNTGIDFILRKHQKRVKSYLTSNKWAQVIYNPLLAKSFRILFLRQRDEFIRLYGRPPEFINGHHHMHLCINMLVGAIIPRGTRVRRAFTFERGEKKPLNILYRLMVGNYISKRFISTDSFFAIAPVQNHERVRYIVNRGARETVELEVHPENREEAKFLLSDQFERMVDSVELGSFRNLGV